MNSPHSEHIFPINFSECCCFFPCYYHVCSLQGFTLCAEESGLYLSGTHYPLVTMNQIHLTPIKGQCSQPLGNIHSSLNALLRRKSLAYIENSMLRLHLQICTSHSEQGPCEPSDGYMLIFLEKFKEVSLSCT